MRIQILAFCLAGLLPTTSAADMLPGADDPRFIATITMALATNDPQALTDLYALAAAGNIAALVALPTVERWLPRTGTLAERAKLRKINGTPVTDLADAASLSSRLWRQGAASDDMAEQLDRAIGLYGLGETGKGDTLLATWFNNTGGFPPLPAGFADLPTSAWLKAAIVENRLNPFVGNPTPDPEGALAILNEWLSVDRLEGWIVLAHVTGQAGGRTISPDEAQYVDDLLAKVFVDPSPMVSDQAPSRMAAAALVWNAAWHHLPDAPLPDVDVQTLWQTLSAQAEFTPVTLYCTAHCPADPPNCERAYLQAFGYQPGNFTWFEPQSDAVAPATFYASPRAEHLLITNGITYALHIPPDALSSATAVPALATAITSDACFAAAVIRVLTTPLPGTP
jgi:hypothetical protein